MRAVPHCFHITSEYDKGTWFNKDIIQDYSTLLTKLLHEIIFSILFKYIVIYW